MGDKMNIIGRFLASLIISMFVTSACNLANPASRELAGLRTVFTADEIPDQANPPTFFRIDWSWGDKLTIQGMGFERFPVFIGDIDTGNISPLYFNNSVLVGPIPLLSKDGRYLTVQLEGKLYIIRMDKIASDNYSIAANSYADVLDKEFRCNNLAWSPDSSQLASVCLAPAGITISLYDLSKKNFQNIFMYSEKYIDGIEGMSWSSDGRMLAFSLRYEHHDEQLSQTDIFIYHLDMRSLDRITNTPTISERNPDWYPRSSVLTFAATRQGDAESKDSNLVFSTEDGKCMKTLPNLKGIVYPSWSPDGTQLAYIDSWIDIKVMDISQFVPSDFLSPQGLCNQQ